MFNKKERNKREKMPVNSKTLNDERKYNDDNFSIEKDSNNIIPQSKFLHQPISFKENESNILSPDNLGYNGFLISTPLCSIFKKSVPVSPIIFEKKKQIKPILPDNIFRNHDTISLMNIDVHKDNTPNKTNNLQKESIFLEEKERKVKEIRLQRKINKEPKIKKKKFQNSKSTVSINFIKSKEANFSCNCQNSKCLKLYCDCLRNNGFCGPKCNCLDCKNYENSKEREEKIKSIKKRNPFVFKPIVSTEHNGIITKIHSKGCSCKKNGCQKNYCECYQLNVLCSTHCKCIECRNCEEYAFTFGNKKASRFKIQRINSIINQDKTKLNCLHF